MTVTGSVAACSGSGILSSSTPSWGVAVISLGSTPSGSGLVREKVPLAPLAAHDSRSNRARISASSANGSQHVMVWANLHLLG